MLRGIPNIISPDLLKILMEMGHGDEILIADGNFPAASHAQRLVRADGHSVPEILTAVLQLFPVDSFVEKPVALMSVDEGMKKPEIWEKYEALIAEESSEEVQIEHMDHTEFMNRAKKCYVIVSSGETALFANIILRKGVV
ncbi:RbsD/FucU family protein [Lactovum odontotermitis]